MGRIGLGGEVGLVKARIISISASALRTLPTVEFVPKFKCFAISDNKWLIDA